MRTYNVHSRTWKTGQLTPPGFQSHVYPTPWRGGAWVFRSPQIPKHPRPVIIQSNLPESKVSQLEKCFGEKVYMPMITKRTTLPYLTWPTLFEPLWITLCSFRKYVPTMKRVLPHSISLCPLGKKWAKSEKGPGPFLMLPSISLYYLFSIFVFSCYLHFGGHKMSFTRDEIRWHFCFEHLLLYILLNYTQIYWFILRYYKYHVFLFPVVCLSSFSRW